MELLEKELKKYEENGAYQTRIAGDISSFRYPHLSYLADNFSFDDKLKCFMLNNPDEKVFKEISVNDITTYELLSTKAKRLHLYDFFGFKPTMEEKCDAYMEVKKSYEENRQRGGWLYSGLIEKVNIGNVRIRDDFAYLNKFINKSRNCDVYFYKFQDADYMFQFGSTLKGTNIVITDNNKSNYYQELFHIIYHLEETIPGVNQDNLNIEEIWGNADALYLKQLMDGRMSRRIRKNKSPHDVKFLDYVFLRAYLGTAFAEENEQLYYHSAFALIEPTIKLLFSCIDGDIKEKNRIIIDSICFDKTDELKEAFNKRFGVGAYEKVFYDFKLFNRLNTIKELCIENKIDYNEISGIMFDSSSLVPTAIESDVVRYIWENESINQDKNFIINLIENYSKYALDNNEKINMNNLDMYLTSKGMVK